MDLRQLEYFAALARERHFTRAAEACHISQPNLSKQIQALERSFGVPLLQRLGRSVHLTDAGQALLRHAEAMLAEAEQIRLLSLDYRGLRRGRLVVGAMGAPSAYLMPRVAARFKQAHPDVALVIESLSSEAIYEGLERNSVHLGVAYAPSERPALSFEPLFDEELVLVVPKVHALARRKRVRLAELAGLPLTLSKDMACRRILDRACQQAGITLSPTLEMASVEGLRAMIEQGLGVTLMARMYWRSLPSAGRMAVVPVIEPPLIEPFGLVMHRDRHRCTALNGFIRAIEEETGPLLAS